MDAGSAPRPGGDGAHSQETIDIKRALHQRFFLRYALRAAMAGIIICLMYIFAYGIKTESRPSAPLRL